MMISISLGFVLCLLLVVNIIFAHLFNKLIRKQTNSADETFFIFLHVSIVVLTIGIIMTLTT